MLIGNAHSLRHVAMTSHHKMAEPMTEAPRIRKIIAATDLSKCAGIAVLIGREIARRTGGELTVVHVDRPADKRSRAEAELDRHLAGLSGVKRIIATGAPASEILGAADLVDADLIVIGTRGHGPIRRALLGSVAKAVILDSRRPVLSVRCGKTAPAPDFRRIVCAVNYTAVSGKAFALALAFASAFDAQLQVVYVVERKDLTKREDERLRAWVRNDAVESKVIARKGTAAATVMAFAKSHGADLLVIGARRKILSKKTPLGSTATALTHKADCPVLIVSGRRLTRSAK